MPQNKEVHAEYMRKRRKGSQEDVTLNTEQYPAIVHALADPVKRVKLEKIYLSLKNFGQAENVYYGCGKGSVPFDVVGDLLEATAT